MKKSAGCAYFFSKIHSYSLNSLGDNPPSGQGVAGGAEQDEDVPDGVEVAVVVVFGKKLRADAVEHTFGDDAPEGEVGQGLPKRPHHQHRHPTHDQVEGQRHFRVFAEGDGFADDSGHHAQPHEDKQRPAHPASEHFDGDERVAAGNHDIDAAVVEHAQLALERAGFYIVVNGAVGKHHEHPEKEQYHAEQAGGRYGCGVAGERPGEQQGCHDAGNVRPDIGSFFFRVGGRHTQSVDNGDNAAENHVKVNNFPQFFGRNAVKNQFAQQGASHHPDQGVQTAGADEGGDKSAVGAEGGQEDVGEQKVGLAEGQVAVFVGFDGQQVDDGCGAVHAEQPAHGTAERSHRRLQAPSRPDVEVGADEEEVQAQEDEDDAQHHFEVRFAGLGHIAHGKPGGDNAGNQQQHDAPPIDQFVARGQNVGRLAGCQNARYGGGFAVRRAQVGQHGHNEHAKAESAHPLHKTGGGAHQHEQANGRNLHKVETKVLKNSYICGI